MVVFVVRLLLLFPCLCNSDGRGCAMGFIVRSIHSYTTQIVTTLDSFRHQILNNVGTSTVLYTSCSWSDFFVKLLAVSTGICRIWPLSLLNFFILLCICLNFSIIKNLPMTVTKRSWRNRFSDSRVMLCPREIGIHFDIGL